MNAGSVIKWIDFPNPRHGDEIKTRWFICLGKTGLFVKPEFLYLCTTTTNFVDFEKGEKREGHRKIHFYSNSSPFEEDCILDIDETPYSIEESKINNNSNIMHKGKLIENKLREIYNQIYLSPYYGLKVKIDIHNSFNKINITKLKMPKRRKR